MEKEDIYILAVESSCDETAASVVRNGREVLSNVIYSQIDLHTLYGGVVPEIASRKHIEKINQVIEKALSDAGITLQQVTAVAVTYGPGLVGALLVGVSAAKAIAFAAGKPLVGVHHIEGHISANYIENKDLEPPFICLVVSGGHSHLVVVKDYGEYEIIGRTRDDAAGEAFDKVARAIGLGYPGGPKIDRVSREGNPDAVVFPRAKVDGSTYDFSFSGLKSAVLNYLNSCEMKGIEICQDEDLISITLPGLLPKRKQHVNAAFLHEPLNYALQNYLTVHSLPLYRECVVCFSQIYDRNGPFDRVRDYDNLEFKQLLDTIATYIMVDDSGLYCDSYHTTELGDTDHTVIYVMGKSRFPQWLKGRKNEIETISEIS